MNVYIKSFNRPFYLDRCIRTIKFNVKNYDKIVVLDDGTLSKYMVRLADIHPDVEFRSSGADDGKYNLLREEKFELIRHRYPLASDFWVTELSTDKNEYFFLMEDDAWVCRRLDLHQIVLQLAQNSAVIYKCWWGDETNHYHDVDRTLRAANGQTIDFFRLSVSQLSDIYGAWIVAFAIFRKDYWLNNFSGLTRMADEQTQLCNAYDFISHNPLVKFAKSHQRVVYQGWAVPGRSTPEYYDKGLRQHLYMDSLNEAWHTGILDVSENYPFDFSDEYVELQFSQHLTQAQIDIWKSWKKSEVKYYY